ncbi:hypothetical protein ACJMK2_019482, partial [Sinanodonta woodiana]
EKLQRVLKATSTTGNQVHRDIQGFQKEYLQATKQTFLLIVPLELPGSDICDPVEPD